MLLGSVFWQIPWFLWAGTQKKKKKEEVFSYILSPTSAYAVSVGKFLPVHTYMQGIALWVIIFGEEH